VCSAGWRPAAGCCWRTHWKLCIADADPVTPGRSLVIPRRHGADGLALHQPEWNAVVELLKLRREQLSAQDASISGWNVGLNSGEAAGQTVFHAHPGI
jgi:ATP adenylyltransferase